MKQGDVAGILYLPADFEARVARGETSVFVLYAATDAFLNFNESARISRIPFLRASASSPVSMAITISIVWKMMTIRTAGIR